MHTCFDEISLALAPGDGSRHFSRLHRPHSELRRQNMADPVRLFVGIALGTTLCPHGLHTVESLDYALLGCSRNLIVVRTVSGRARLGRERPDTDFTIVVRCVDGRCLTPTKADVPLAFNAIISVV